MPKLDRTGPMGQGSMTGGKRGRCNPTPDTKNDSAESQPNVNDNATIGLGRGGVPKGGGGLGRGGNPRGRGGLGRGKSEDNASSLHSDACRNGISRRYGCNF